MRCPRCGSENRADAKFCGECGVGLGALCPVCGAGNEPNRRFCYQCGSPLAQPAEQPPPEERARGVGAPASAVAERRLVSVLFADLVGFTALSESRDAEEVRELLSRYFAGCRRLVELYGGTIEKFIGDAVMAVWGTPVAQEDDAERAVRAALDLVVAVSALGEEVGAPELRARAGVLTGEAAVNLAAAGEGMVVGDLVNTAARVQAEAEPGTVLVGEATKRVTQAAIAYAEAGEHLLKGKAEPVALWRAVRVTAARGGALRSQGLEAPFVGRKRELRLVKELYHVAAEQSRAQFVQVGGIAGIGKSRLSWEFFKYLDGLAEQAFWHRGRCLAYGEGIAYWPLAEMVRSRAGILEAEEPGAARTKLAACLAEHLPDREERDWVEPRLANLLGLEERSDSDRQDLFAAWRLFFARLADQDPVVLVFEDLQWADAALLAFIEYLLEWSGSQRLYVLALARPELFERHPEFGRTIRNAAQLALEPLTEAEMDELLDGYVPGLPEDLRARIRAQAQGVPLYAVETVRMLLDRGLLVRDGAAYRPTGPVERLEVPETLHALAAARLDGLPPPERRLVQEAAVLGKSFSLQLLAALSGHTRADLELLLTGLVHKEVLALHADPRVPERGRYAFLQELVRQVAYETLSRRDRKARHLAAAAALEESRAESEPEAPEALAAHLLAAAVAAPDDADVGEIRARARQALVAAGERAAGLAAPEEAQRYLDQAVALVADDARLRAELLASAGRLAYRAGRPGEARQRLEQAIDLQERLNEPAAAARASVLLADVDLAESRLEQASRRFAAAVEPLERAGAGEELAATLAELGRMQLLRGEHEQAAQALERALQLAETHALEEVLVQALTSKATLLLWHDRSSEAEILLRAAVDRSRAAGLHDAWWRAANNLALLLEQTDRPADSLALVEEIETQARQRGDREQLAATKLGAIPLLVQLGRWQEALDRSADPELVTASPYARLEVTAVVPVLCERGDLAAAQALLHEQEWQRTAEHAEGRASFAAAEARLLRLGGDAVGALAAARRGLACRRQLGITSVKVKRCLVEALEAALVGGSLDTAEQLLRELEQLPAGQLGSYLEGEHARFRARYAQLRDEGADVEDDYRRAETTFRVHGFDFELALSQREHADWLSRRDRNDEAAPLLAAARATLERLGTADGSGPARERPPAAPASTGVAQSA